MLLFFLGFKRRWIGKQWCPSITLELNFRHLNSSLDDIMLWKTEIVAAQEDNSNNTSKTVTCRSLVSAIKQVGLQAKEMNGTIECQYQNCWNAIIPTTPAMSVVPERLCNAIVMLRPPTSRMPWNSHHQFVACCKYGMENLRWHCCKKITFQPICKVKKAKAEVP